MLPCCSAILFILIGLMLERLEQHKDELLMTEFSFLGELMFYIFK